MVFVHLGAIFGGIEWLGWFTSSSSVPGRECEAACECSNFCEPLIKERGGHGRPWRRENDGKPPEISQGWSWLIVHGAVF